MGEAKRRGTTEQRRAAAEQEHQAWKATQDQREREKKHQKAQAERDRYLKEVEAFGEEEADRRYEARKDARHRQHMQVAQLAGLLAGTFLQQRRPDAPSFVPTSLDDFENL